MSTESGRDSQVGRTVHERTGLQDDLTRFSSLIGRKWHLVIIRQLRDKGPLGFSDLKDEIEGISGKVLSESLEDLSDNGLVGRTVVNERPFRVEYSLTERGETFGPVIDAVCNGDFEVEKSTTNGTHESGSAREFRERQ